MATSNWFQRLASPEASEWGFRDRGIFSNFGWRDFSVVEVLQNRTPEISWINSIIVPCRTIATYSDDETGESHYDEVGKVRKIIPENLYRTLGDLIKHQSQVAYPDLTLELMQKPHIASFLRDFPEMEGDLKPGDVVDYQIFDVQGYEVQVFNDTQAQERNPGILQTRGTEGLFYWHIPELQTRSFESKPGIDKSPWGTGRYPTMNRALESAEQFVNFSFYGE
jgi:hypothetical protein